VLQNISIGIGISPKQLYRSIST